MDMKDNKMIGELRRPAIKKEHVSERLPSLRGKRDLTLGGVPKKTYSPVIPARKARPEPAATNSINNDESKHLHKKKKEDREKTPRRPKKSRDKDVLTSASVFSMGPAEQLIKSGRNASHSSRDGGKVNHSKHRPFQAVKQEPMDTATSTLADEVEEGLDGSCDFSFSQYPPVQLPLDPTRHAKQPLKANKSTKSSISAVKPKKDNETSHVPTAAELFSNPGDKAHMLFLQLPDSLPVTGAQDEPMDTDQLNSSKSDNTKQTHPSGSCDLSQLPTGYLGKIQVHKSGRVKLLLGTNSLDVTMGTPCDFQQDLVSIHSDTDGDTNPHMVTLGQLSHRLICLPDLDQLLTNNTS